MSISSISDAPTSRNTAAEVRQIVAGSDDGRATYEFLSRSADRLAAVLADVHSESDDVRCELVRSRLKPGSKLQAYYTVCVPGAAPRPAAVTWVDPWRSVRTADNTPPARAGTAPFSSLHVTVPDEGMTVLLAPFDPAFPDLPCLYETEQLAALMRTAGARDANDVQVTPLRYRPGQRHVLRIDLPSSGRRLYAKCYRDGTGERAVRRAEDIGVALADADGAARVAVPFATVADIHLVLWTGVLGTPLSTSVATTPDPAHRAGRALRTVHDDARISGAALATERSDPRSEAATTERAVRHITALRPHTGDRLLRLLHEAERELIESPAESGHVLHGDYKCDNLIVGEDGALTLLDFDRVTVGDPALDLGKFSADLRWWARLADVDGDALVATFLDGYGHGDGRRLERAAAYDVIFQLRAAGRRVPLHEPRWAATVDTCVAMAATSGGRR